MDVPSRLGPTKRNTARFWLQLVATSEIGLIGLNLSRRFLSRFSARKLHFLSDFRRRIGTFKTNAVRPHSVRRRIFPPCRLKFILRSLKLGIPNAQFSRPYMVPIHMAAMPTTLM